jgi:hypothetical protein
MVERGFLMRQLSRRRLDGRFRSYIRVAGADTLFGRIESVPTPM